jgi:hypothetical protein
VRLAVPAARQLATKQPELTSAEAQLARVQK